MHARPAVVLALFAWVVGCEGPDVSSMPAPSVERPVTPSAPVPTVERDALTEVSEPVPSADAGTVTVGRHADALRVRFDAPSGFHAVTVHLENTSTRALLVEVPTGLYLVNANAGEQPLVTVESAQTTVAAGARASMTVATACADVHRDIPSATTSFSLGESPKAGVATFLQVYTTVHTQVTRVFAATGVNGPTVLSHESASVTRQMIVWKWYGAPDDAIARRLVDGYTSFGGDRALAQSYVATTSAEFERVVVLIDTNDTAGLQSYLGDAGARLAERAQALGAAAGDRAKQEWGRREERQKQVMDGAENGVKAVKDFWNSR